jgi:asparagine synthetase B (glutamine-hydrolysing)
MCGISCIFHHQEPDERLGHTALEMEHILSQRGPTTQGHISIRLHAVDSTLQNLSLSFIASVLHIQGSIVTSQPYIDDEGSILLWNGEVFGVFSETLKDCAFSKNFTDGDTSAVSHYLRNALSMYTNPELDDLNQIGQDLTNRLSSLKGPFAFIYFHKPSYTLHYGRDSFGRRSLLACKDAKFIHGLCSVNPYSQFFGQRSWEEVSIEGIFSIRLYPLESLKNRELEDSEVTHSPLFSSLLTPWPSWRIKLHRSLIAADRLSIEATSPHYLRILHHAVQIRVDSMNSSHSLSPNHLPSCRIGVLFSGGLDSAVLAVLLHLSLRDMSEPIELINVSFHSQKEEGKVKDSPDRLSAIVAFDELTVSGLFLTLQLTHSLTHLHLTHTHSHLTHSHPTRKPPCSLL